MLTALFSLMMIAVFGRLFFFGIKLAWGIGRIVLSVVMIPLVLIGLFVSGLIYIAFPALIILGIISLLTVPSRT